MGLLRAGIIGIIGVVTIEFIKNKEKLISKIPFMNSIVKNKIDYSYLLLIIIFVIELIL